MPTAAAIGPPLIPRVEPIPRPLNDNQSLIWAHIVITVAPTEILAPRTQTSSSKGSRYSCRPSRGHLDGPHRVRPFPRPHRVATSSHPQRHPHRVIYRSSSEARTHFEQWTTISPPRHPRGHTHYNAPGPSLAGESREGARRVVDRDVCWRDELLRFSSTFRHKIDYLVRTLLIESAGSFAGLISSKSIRHPTSIVAWSSFPCRISLSQMRERRRQQRHPWTSGRSFRENSKLRRTRSRSCATS